MENEKIVIEETHDRPASDIGSIAAVIDALVGRVYANEALALREVAGGPAVEGAAQCLRSGDLSGFDRHLSDPVGMVARGLLAQMLPGRHDAWFLVLNRRFIKAHFRWVIERKEGSGCCADKTRAIVHRLFRLLAFDEPVVFDPDALFTFHYPKTVFAVQGEIVEFFRALRGLHHGNPSGYLSVMHRILSGTPQAGSPSADPLP